MDSFTTLELGLEVEDDLLALKPSPAPIDPTMNGDDMAYLVDSDQRIQYGGYCVVA